MAARAATVVHEHDASVAGVFHDAVDDGVDAWAGPVGGVNSPHDHLFTLLSNGVTDCLVNESAWGAHAAGAATNRGIGAGEFVGNAIWCDFCQPWVCVGVVADGVAASSDLFDQARVVFRVAAEHEEGGFGIVLFEQVQNLGCVFGAGAVVKCEVDDFAVLFRFAAGLGYWLCGRGRCGGSWFTCFFWSCLACSSRPDAGDDQSCYCRCGNRFAASP